MRHILLAASVVLALAPCVRADDLSKQMQIASLNREIESLEQELAACQRKQKNWKTATIVGAVGTAATATGAIVQGVKLHNMKKQESEEKKQKND